MKFLTKDQVTLSKSNKLVENKVGILAPITNGVFQHEQEVAHYYVTLAKNMKGKNYKELPVEDLKTTIDETIEEISKGNSVIYTEETSKPVTKTIDKLTAESLKWVEYRKEEELNEKVNETMQQFNEIKTFEDFGLFFEEGIGQLNKIYTIEEILKAVTFYHKSLK